MHCAGLQNFEIGHFGGLHGIAGKRVVINMAGTGVPKLNLASIGVVTNAANK
jgi:hypothetical protein